MSCTPALVDGGEPWRLEQPPPAEDRKFRRGRRHRGGFRV
jgi:hypothetical protein